MMATPNDKSAETLTSASDPNRSFDSERASQEKDTRNRNICNTRKTEDHQELTNNKLKLRLPQIAPSYIISSNDGSPPVIHIPEKEKKERKINDDDILRYLDSDTDSDTSDIC